MDLPYLVAPLVGARIEIDIIIVIQLHAAVAPLVGARIEIVYAKSIIGSAVGRSPRGSED